MRSYVNHTVNRATAGRQNRQNRETKSLIISRAWETSVSISDLDTQGRESFQSSVALRKAWGLMNPVIKPDEEFEDLIQGPKSLGVTDHVKRCSTSQVQAQALYQRHHAARTIALKAI